MPQQFPALDPLLVDDFVRDGYIYDLYDGDTVYYHANLGYNHVAAFQTGRLLDVWAAEVRPLRSRAEGMVAKKHLQSLIEKYALNRHIEQQPYGFHIKIRTYPGKNKWFKHAPLPRKGKYGRWLVTLIGADDQGKPFNINEEMVRSGHATSRRDR
mgnify:CR=1 FL=1